MATARFVLLFAVVYLDRSVILRGVRQYQHVDGIAGHVTLLRQIQGTLIEIPIFNTIQIPSTVELIHSAREQYHVGIDKAVQIGHAVIAVMGNLHHIALHIIPIGID